MSDGPLDVTKFAFRLNDDHNRVMLEFQAEKAFRDKNHKLAAAYAQAAGLYAVANAVRLLQMDGAVTVAIQQEKDEVFAVALEKAKATEDDEHD